MRIAVYIRVSKVDMNPQNQRVQLEEYCRTKGWDFETFEELESTRKIRPIKQKVITDLKAGLFDGVLIWKLDRWARSLKELIIDTDYIMSLKKEFIVMTQPIDTTSASGRLFMQIVGAFAEFEREMIRERTIAGLFRVRSEGKYLGNQFRGMNGEKVDKTPAEAWKIHNEVCLLAASLKADGERRYYNKIIAELARVHKIKVTQAFISQLLKKQKDNI